MTHMSMPPRRRRSPMLDCLLATVGLVSVMQSAQGQEAGNVTIDARRCMQIEAPAERLECFEGQVGAAAGATSSGAPPPVPTAAAPPAAQSQAGASRESGSSGNITALQARQPNRYLITLDNGQMWEQEVADRFALRVGQHVRIQPSKWGNSQRLYVDGVKGYIQVVRVR